MASKPLDDAAEHRPISSHSDALVPVVSVSAPKLSQIVSARLPVVAPVTIPVPTNSSETIAADRVKNLCLHRLIEEQVERTPHQTAVAYEQQKLTYQELNRRSNLLALQLRQMGAGPDQVVGLLIERSAEMVVAMLGILKAGAAYVPIDVSFPKDRIAYILADANAALLITETNLLEQLPSGIGAQTICLDALAWTGAPSAQISPRYNPANLAYVIYTSGSTGRPKGVGVEHRSIVNYVLGISERLKLEPGMNHAMISTVSADLGNTVLFPALVTGGCLHLISDERAKSQAKLSEYFQRENIDVLKITPSHLAALQTGKNPQLVMPRKRLVLGGEASRIEWIGQLRSLAPGCEILNHYGPTEATVGALTYHVEEQLPTTRSGSLPIGRPLPETRVYILDASGHPVSGDAEGEIFIGGAGVARGYLNRPDLTAQQFVPEFSRTVPSARMYRTGDLGRYLPDGNIEFRGRIDDQVKIHGYRVELGEIEGVLRDQPGVREALVLASDDSSGNKQLVAYVVPSRMSQPLWENKSIYVLPDGSPVACRSQRESDHLFDQTVDQIFVQQTYTRHGVTIQDGDCILHVGADIGLFEIFASRVARNLRLICLESNPVAFACLSANAEAWAPDATCLQLGIRGNTQSAESEFFGALLQSPGIDDDAALDQRDSDAFTPSEQRESGNYSRFAEELTDSRTDAASRSAVGASQPQSLSGIIRDQAIDRIDLLCIHASLTELEVLEELNASDWSTIRQVVIQTERVDDLESTADALRRQDYEVVVDPASSTESVRQSYLYAIRRSERQPETARGAEIHLRPLSASDREILTPLTLRSQLNERLPQYMVPAGFVLLEQFPLNANGKIDRKALPVFAQDSSPSSRNLVAPRNETERKLAAIWSDLLKVKDVSVEDNFFDLGGHSLLAIKAASRIRDVFEADLPAQVLFESSTIAELATLLAQAKSSTEVLPIRIERRDQDGPSPLSFPEEQLWFLNQLAPASAVYNVVDVIDLGDKYDGAALTRTVQEIVRRHEILRTRFTYSDEQPMQAVLPDIDFTLAEFDLTPFAAPERDREWVRVVQEQSRRAFDLSQPPLFRGAVVHRSSEEHKLVFAIHHIIADEWSMEVLHKELTQIYRAFLNRRPSPLPELPIQYADFARWQREWFQGAIEEEQVTYWKKELAAAAPILDLPTDKPRPAIQSFRGATEFFRLPAKLLGSLKSLGRQEQATLFMALEAAFAALLHRQTGQTDILIGTPISGRTQAEAENLIGYFLNTIVLRSRFTENMSFRSLLQQTRARALGAYAHADLPFKHLVTALAPERDPSRSPLFQVMFILHDPDGVSEVSKVSGKHELQTGTSKFDLTLIISETESGLEGLLEYSTDLFEAETIRRTSRHFATILEEVAHNPDQSVSALQVLSAPELQQLSVEWNDTAVDFPDKNSSLHSLIERQAAMTPQNVALVFDQQKLTFGELDRRANQLARHLKELGVGPDVLVGLCVERSLEMVIAMQAVLKAGGAYVPLDPSFPQNRLTYMVENSKMSVLLTHRHLDDRLLLRPSVVVHLDSDWSEIAKQSTQPLESPDFAPQNLAYVLYTSGSTGRPKGVAIPHSAIANFLLSMQREPGFTADDTLLAVTTLSFDIAGLELFLPLITGGKIVIASREETQDPAQLMRRMEQSACTVMQATPATWRALINAGWRGSWSGTASGTPRLKILCGGEAILPDLAKQLLARCGELWNMYGPTETTVWSTIHRVTSVDGPVPIGHPIANTQVYILDEARNLVPAGNPGELYIGGDGLAKGYLHQEKLTAERFVANSFTPGTRLYRTGDLARWRPDGTVECLGRMDSQIKLRGYRIELGEIEAVLAGHPAIRHCTVIAREDEPGEKQLVAYYEAQTGSEPTASELRAHLEKDVPIFMIPAAYVQLEKLPLTPNGKVDRKSLPAPTHHRAGSEGFAAPRNECERMLAQIWAKALRVKQVGLHDNFFALGGHSLLAVKIVADIEEITNVRLPLATLLQAPTIAGLAECLQKENWTPNWSSLVPLRAAGSKPPLYLFHAHGGDVLEYHALANLLDPDQPVYALQARGLDGNIPKDVTLEGMAAAYLKELRSFQPEGPYFLAGFCFGGLVALEAAQQLRAQGQEVAILLLIQTTHPAVFHFKEGLPTVKKIWYRLTKQISLETENLSHQGIGYLRQRYQKTLDMIRVRRAIASGGRNGNTVDPVRLPKLYLSEALRVEHGKALRKYQTRPYDGEVVLFRASRQLSGLAADEYLGWKPYFKGGFEIREVPGHQQNLMLQPNVRQVAKEMNAQLRSVQQLYAERTRRANG